ncbi:hypothetical protein [Halovivax ruber]|uniref:hypothetical protein n=1 Tax=Halovivax ruber TaxID=387341 RepID=UPI0011E549F4|nr:hypothetical protein [Halovivax ruber]
MEPVQPALETDETFGPTARYGRSKATIATCANADTGASDVGSAAALEGSIVDITDGDVAGTNTSAER